jgi:hypothetical protein
MIPAVGTSFLVTACCTACGRAAADRNFVRSTEVPDSLIAEGLAIAEPRLAPSGLRRATEHACYALRHPKLPFLSYPYEWCFTAQRSPLLHFDV